MQFLRAWWQQVRQSSSRETEVIQVQRQQRSVSFRGPSGQCGISRGPSEQFPQQVTAFSEGLTG